ncbi:MAG: hypothetical protein ABEH65_00835 [Halobacteriales archaeon]
MRSSSSFRKLTGVLEQLEQTDIDVVDVTATLSDTSAEPVLRADLTIELPATESTAETAGTTEVPTHANQTDEASSIEDAGNGKGSADITATVDSRSSDEESPQDEDETSSSRRSEQTTSETDSKAERESETETEADEEPPVYQDPDRLASVYAEYDSFAAMTEALDVDVTPQTVRRHMIDHGIHDPESRTDTDDDAPVEEAEDGVDDTVDHPDEGDNETTDGATNSDGTENAENDALTADAIPDGVVLPDGIDIEALKRIVTDARTIHDIQRELSLDRESTRELLESFNLLECVLGRLEEVDREIPPEEIDERIDTATRKGNA